MRLNPPSGWRPICAAATSKAPSRRCAGAAPRKRARSSSRSSRLDGTAELFGPAPQSAFDEAQPTDRAFTRLAKEPEPDAKVESGSGASDPLRSRRLGGRGRGPRRPTFPRCGGELGHDPGKWVSVSAFAKPASAGEGRSEKIMPKCNKSGPRVVQSSRISSIGYSLSALRIGTCSSQRILGRNGREGRSSTCQCCG